MNKIKINIDAAAAALMLKLSISISQATNLIPGLELEHLVLADFIRRNYTKIQFNPSGGYKLHLEPPHSIAMYRVLMNWGLADPMLIIVRDEICNSIKMANSNQNALLKTM